MFHLMINNFFFSLLFADIHSTQREQGVTGVCCLCLLYSAKHYSNINSFHYTFFFCSLYIYAVTYFSWYHLFKELYQRLCIEWEIKHKCACFSRIEFYFSRVFRCLGWKILKQILLASDLVVILNQIFIVWFINLASKP